MSWLVNAASDEARMQNNIERLVNLKEEVHDLAYFVVASPSQGHEKIKGLVEDRLVKGRPPVHEALTRALWNENSQKLALDAPNRCQGILLEAENVIAIEADKEERSLKKLLSEKEDD